MLKNGYKKYLFKCLSLAILLIPATSHAVNFNKVYLFGDSMSDGGWSSTAKISGVKKGYTTSNICGYESRTTNGLTAVENAVAKLGMLNTTSFENYAVYGASTYDLLTRTQGTTQITGQVNQMLSNNNQTVSANALSIIFMGANDLGAKVYAGVSFATANDAEINAITNNAMTNIVNSMNTLASKGAKKILVINQPNFKYWYGIKRLNNEALAEKMAKNFNLSLSNKVVQFSAANPTINVKIFDLFEVSEWFFTAPIASKSFTQAPLWDETELVEHLCQNMKAQNISPDYSWPIFGKDIYFDDIHLTKRAHDYFGDLLGGRLGQFF